MNKITIIGGGNIGLSLAKGLVKTKYCKANEITITRRNLASLTVEKEEGFSVSDSNPEAIQGAEFIVLAILPQQIRKVMDELAPVLTPAQTIISDRKSTRLNSSHVKISY